ncbi:hypothetical protein C8R43DRAFT_1233356 [Mycena crocata]|nr:hypothetical protein C8R43DRAFT_1233356 [Mycena crocata]
MASASDLRARIAVVSSAIIRQKQVLRDLESTKCHLEKSLNTILDPMARLPLEISSEIFMLGMGTDGGNMRTIISRPHPNLAPMVYLNVCCSWKQIAASTPSLWTAIHVNGTGRYAAALIHAWFARAGSRLLTISSRGNLSDAFRNVMHHHAHRIQILELDVPSDTEVQHVAEKPFPALSKLYIASSDDETSDFPDADSCVAMMLAAPALVECKFSSIHYHYFPESESPSTHSSLKHLHFGSYPSKYDTSTAAILMCLTLPALESLSITDFDISYEDFIAFFTRSSPRLQSLRMYLPRAEWSASRIESLLQVMPNLTRLDLRFRKYLTANPPHLNGFIQALAEYSPQKLLPNLHTLVMWGVFDLEHSHYVKLVDLLSTRQPQLCTFRLMGEAYQDFPSPDAAIIASMRKLVADGMEIYVGKYDNNLI